MPLFVHRARRVERLVTLLARHLVASLPADPFAAAAVVVGSRGMERWLRHELATQLGVAARIEFPFPRHALDGAARWLLAEAGARPDPWWSHEAGQTTGAAGEADAPLRAWGRADLAVDVALALRAHRGAPGFEQVSGYLSEGGRSAEAEALQAGEPGQARQAGEAGETSETSGDPFAAPLSARELGFADQVADVLDRLMHDRHRDALAWARETEDAPEQVPEPHRWLAALLRDLGVHDDPSSPARLLAALEELRPDEVAASAEDAEDALRPCVRIFGLSTLGAGDRARLRALARHVDVHLYMAVPSQVWWEHIHSAREQVRALRTSPSPDDHARLVEEYRSQNGLLASLAMPSRDLQTWLESLPADEAYREVAEELVELEASGQREPGQQPPGTSMLAILQDWVAEAGDVEALAAAWADRAIGSRVAGAGETAPAPAHVTAGGACDDSMAFHATHGPMRQCEVLRDQLLAAFERDPTLEPRHVLVMTPDIETYGPLLSAVFARRGTALHPTAEAAGRAESRDGEHDAAPSRGRLGATGSLPAIPAAVADLGLTRTNPVAEVMMRVLQLSGSRVTAADVLDLCGLEPVRNRLGLSPEDPEILRELTLDSEMRWAFDAADRARHEQPAEDAFTLRFGLERLALGALMPDDAGLVSLEGPGGGGASEAAGRMLPASAPVALRTTDRVRLAGTLGRVIRLLQATALRCAEPATAPVWRARLRDTLDALAATSDDTAWLRREVETHLDAFVDQLAGGPETPVPNLSREAVLQWFRGDFELPQRGDRPITGGVTVCALQPMRSVPFRIVALVGMDDGSFPRGGSPRTWDPFDDRRLGERDGREVDRHLLLEALMSARDAFWILWTGFSVTRGDERPAAVPVEELLETLGRAAVPGEDDEAQRRALVRPHPLQPWGYGEALGARPEVFDLRLARAAEALERGRAGRAAEAGDEAGDGAVPAQNASDGSSPGAEAVVHGDEALGPEPHPPTAVTLTELARGLARPQELLLNRRLQLRFDTPREVPEPREPLEVESGLGAWALRTELLRMQVESDASTESGSHPEDGDEPEARKEAALRRAALQVAAQGRLPLGAQGITEVRDAWTVADALRDAVARTGGDPYPEGLELSVELGLAGGIGDASDGDRQDALRLVGQLSDLRARAAEGDASLRLLWSRASMSSVSGADRRLTSHLAVMAAAAMGVPLDAELLGPGDGKKRPYSHAGARLDANPEHVPTPAQARARLSDLASLWMDLRREPLPLLPKMSLAVAEALVKQGITTLAQLDEARRDEERSDVDKLDVDKLVTAARSALASTDYHRGDMADDYVRRLHEGLASEAALQRVMAQTGPRSAVGLAARLWLPVFAHEVSQDEFESRWRSP